MTGYEITKNSHLPGDYDEIYNIIRNLEKHPSLNRLVQTSLLRRYLFSQSFTTGNMHLNYHPF